MYVGQQPVVGRYILLDQISGGFNGTASGFTMTAGGQGVIPGLAQNVLLSLGGVIQQPGVDYLVSGSGLTFTTPPVSGTTFFATVLGDAQAVGTPSDGTVIPASIASSGTFVFPNVTVTGVTTIASGTAAAPSLSVSGDANTGLYSPGADQLAIATSGTGRLFVDASGNVSVNTSSSNGRLTVNATTSSSVYATADAGYAILDAATNASGARFNLSGGDATNGVNLWGYNSTRTGYTPLNYGGSQHIFKIGSSEVARLDANGRLGLGSSSPVAKFQINSPDTLDIPGFTIRQANNVNAGYDFDVNNSTGGMVIYGNNENNATRKILLGFDRIQGRVGIGTTGDPGGFNARLSVDNTADTYVTVNTTGSANVTGLHFRNSNSNGEARIVNNTGGALTFYGNASTERCRLTSDGKWLVGTSTARTFGSLGTTGYQQEATGYEPASASWTLNQNTVDSPWLVLAKSRGTSNGSFTVVSDGDNLGRISFQGADGSVFRQGASIVAQADAGWSSGDAPGRLVFSTTPDSGSSPVERLRINNAGSAYFYSASGNASEVSTAVGAGTSNAVWSGRHSASGTGTGTTSVIIWTNGNIVNTNNSYGSISDIKLKENIVDANSQWDDLKALQVRNYNFKEGQTHTQIGLIAQEVELVSPGLVSESPDRDEDGNDLGTVTKSVNYSVLYMKAVKALQEAMERIETLEAKVAALEAS